MATTTGSGQHEPRVGVQWGVRARTGWVLAHSLLACALGVFADIGLEVDGPVGAVPLLLTPWVLVPYSAARAARGWRSMLVGASTLIIGLTAYYAWLILGRGVLGDTILRHYRAPLWLVAGLVVGLGCGLLAWLSQTKGAVLVMIAWCSVVAVPVADAWLELDRTGSGRFEIVGGLAVVAVGLALLALRQSSLGPVSLVLGVAVAAVLLRSLEVLVLRHLFDMSFY